MLNVIHQNGCQKFLTGTYFVDRQQATEDKKEAFNIVVYVEGLQNPFVAIAQYNKAETAYAIFAHLIKIERLGELALLPIDDEEHVKGFLGSEGGWVLFK